MRCAKRTRRGVRAIVANQPRADNPHRSVRVEDDLWNAAKVAAEKEGTTRAEVMQQALRELVARNT